MGAILWCRILCLVVLLFSAPFSWCSAVCNASDGRDWDFSFHSELDSGICNIPRLHASNVTRERFFREFKNQAPVILIAASDNTVIRKATARPALLDSFGSAPVLLSSANTYSYDTLDQTLTTYVNDLMVPQGLDRLGKETFYNFGGHNPKVWNPLLRLYERPGYLVPGEPYTYSFGIGASGTGVPFHVHGDGFSEVFHGRKRWFLYPPGQEPRLEAFAGQKEGFFRPDESTLQWVAEVYPSLQSDQRPLECVIEPGEALYFPTMWFHAVLNLGETVFISTFT